MRIKQWLCTITLIILSQISLAHIPATAHNSRTLSNILKSDMPAIVKIYVLDKTQNQYQNSQKKSKKNVPSRGLGSGFIINAKQGIIITNAHVIKNAKIIYVILKDSRRYLATVMGKSPSFDIAILKIHAKHLAQIEFANSDTVKVGDVVAAVGSPFGLDQTVTSGVVSALNVSRPKIEGFQSFIQTDAAINPGNSGGPLINLQGKVVGINTAIIGPGSNIGIGFAIPSNMAKNIAQQLIQYKNVQRGMLGVVTQNINPDLRDAMHISAPIGTIVSQVLPNSAADKAGLKTEDIITAINHHAINSSIRLRNLVGLMRPGTKLSIDIIRHKQSQRLTTKIESRQQALMQKVQPFIQGMRLKDFEILLGTGKILKGVIIESVKPTASGALAGLLPGDIITQANHKTIENLSNLESVIKQNPSTLLLRINRGNMYAYMVVHKRSV